MIGKNPQASASPSRHDTRRRLAQSHLRVWMAVALVCAWAIPWPAVEASSTASQPPPQATIRCEPSTAIGRIGEVDLAVDLTVDNVAGLYGIDVLTSFDAVIARVVDQLPAGGVQIEPLATFFQPDFVVRNEADNAAGTIRYASTQVAPAEPVDGSGPVARITFHGLTAGTFSLPLLDVELSDRNGVLIPVTPQPCTVTFLPPLAITLASFEATDETDHVLVRWETASETGNLGFNLYRSENPIAPQQQLNSALIPSQAPGSTQGHRYSWQDFAVRPRHTYYYWLEDVSVTGATEVHGPVSVAFQQPNAVKVSGFTATSARPVFQWVLAWLGVVSGMAWASQPGL